MPERTDLRLQIEAALRNVGGAASPSSRVGGAACSSPSLAPGQAAPATQTVGGAASPSASQTKGQAGPSTFPAAARAFFAALGYRSDRALPIATPRQFRETLDPANKLTDRECEALDRCASLHLLFQVTGAELDDHVGDLLDDRAAADTTRIESYLFFPAELPPGHYTRTDLATLVRAINKSLPMPALVLFRHGETLSLGLIHRRLHRRDAARDVLEKVTLIKDIACADPVRAHLEILNDFALPNLAADYGVASFVALHEAWQKRLGSYALSNDFYREIADWYFWAHHQVADGALRLPLHCDTEQEKSLFLIRLLTRVIFCWFLVEKRLIPADLFREHRLRQLLKDFAPSRDPARPDTSPAYYQAILQNLFFGTLNMPPEQRGFRKRNPAGGRDPNFGVTNLWRYEASFRDPADWAALAARIPFLNGGLFDCLDDKVGGAASPSLKVEGAASPFSKAKAAACPSASQTPGQAGPATPPGQAAPATHYTILDGFSDNPRLACHLPNDLFFGPERTVDLSRDYGEEDKRTARSQRAKVRGLIEILSRYKFTIEENTPLEEEIALDPELLGKVFENLLASYNEDTRTTARKALGAFYTPREIVSYMVDEALKSYLQTQLTTDFTDGPDGKNAPASVHPRSSASSVVKKLAALFTGAAQHFANPFTPDETAALIAAIGRVKILDPACGSGAFPMGALHRLVDLLQKLDPNNESWKRDRLAEARRYRQLLESSNATADELAACDARIADIEKSFDTRYHALDFARKLYLIENAIYGVDIQPIATQIAKLRFFIALVVDQKVSVAGAASPLARVGRAASPLARVGGAASPSTQVGGAACSSLPQTPGQAGPATIPGQAGPATPPGQAGPATPWNLGIRPLPNLETKFVAADTLIPVEKTESDLFSGDLDRLRAELAAIRHEHFNARSPAAKRKWRDADAAKRAELARALEQSHALSKDTARQLAAWDPYDQNTFAPFFDPEWMFGLQGGRGCQPLKVEGAASSLSSNQPGQAGPATFPGQAGPATCASSGFDIVIGNPPYIRIQTLKQKNPGIVAFYKEHYASAAKGNYDIYVVFIEAGLRLLKSDGHLAYICPHKFFNAQYGEPIRELIAKGKHLRHVVHFGDEQVFPGATIYTCLLLLSRATCSECRYVEAHDLSTWIERLAGTEGKFASSGLGKSEWIFTVGAGRAVFEKLAACSQTLSDVAENIFQGLVTSADPIYLLEQLGPPGFPLTCSGYQ